MIFPTALTICVLDSSFALFLFGPDDEADRVIMRLKAVPSFVKRFQLGASSHDITVATTAATRKSACSIIWLPALSESAASVIAHIVEATHQRANTSVVLLSGVTYLPSDLAEGVDVLVSPCANHCALIQSMVNGITHSRQGIDVHFLNDVLTGQQGRWYAAVTKSNGPSRALDAVNSTIKSLLASQQRGADKLCFYLVISGCNVKLAERQVVVRGLLNSVARTAYFLASYVDDESLSEYIHVALFCPNHALARIQKCWLPVCV